MSIRIEERFTVRAPIDRVWAYMVDPRQVVTCLPGAELTGQESDTIFLGKVKIKVGPVTAAYNGRAQIVERDDATHIVRLVGEGRETAGSGSAKMTMTSQLTASPDGSTEVHVSADVDVVGKIVQFGRGMIESVNKQLFKQFVACVQKTLEVSEGDQGTPIATSVGSPAVASPPVGAAPAASSDPSALVAPVATVRPEPPPAPAVAPVRILPLVLRAIWDMITRIWRRSPAN